MGFESSFTLYRKYDTKVTDAEMKKIVGKYAKENRKDDFSEKKKTDREYAKDIPLVLDPLYGERHDTYDKKLKKWVDKRDHSVAGQRRDNQYVLASDGSHLDELMWWHFCSDFNCVADELNLRRSGEEAVIDRPTAEKMLQACNYLLSGKWSDEVEDILDNKWIDIFANGNSGDSYWPYTYRHDKKALNEIPERERNSIRYTIVSTKYALETYLNAEMSSQYGHESEFILVYSISY